MFVVTGASGHTGSIVAQTLLDAGQDVRVILRNPEKAQPWKDRGADVFIATLNDTDALTKAFEGADAAYLMVPPEPVAPDFIATRNEIGEAYLMAAKAAKLPRAVLLSSVGAHLSEGTGPIVTLSYLESLFKGSSVKTTALRPGYFLENWAAVLHPVLEQNILPSFFDPLDLKIDMVATADIGKEAADLLQNPPEGDFTILELHGTDQYSTLDIAAALSSHLSKEITPVPVPQEAWVPTLVEAGLSQQFAESLAEMYANINTGTIDYTDVASRKGQTTLEDFVSSLLA